MSLSLASRLARREVRRRPFRTLLISLLVTVPSLTFLVVSTVSETTSTTREQKFRHENGTADVVLSGISPETTGSSVRAVAEEAKKVFGDNIDVTIEKQRWFPVRVAGDEVRREYRSRMIEVREFQPDDKILGETLELLKGRSARTNDEIVLSARLAEEWGLSVGDHLALEIPQIDFVISGIVRKRQDWTATFVLPRSLDQFARSSPTGIPTSTLRIQIPGGMTWLRFQSEHPEIADTLFNNEQLPIGNDTNSERLRPVEVWQFAQFVDGGPNQYFGNESPNPWLPVLLVLAFAVLSVIITAAFATSARRQLVTLGQLGANGTPMSVLRLSLALQGLWSGIVGIALTFASYLAFLASGHNLVESVLNHEISGWRVPIGALGLVVAVALVSSTLAAWVPSRTASRTSVLDALAGRQRLGNVPRRLLPVGIGLLIGGTVLEFFTAVGARHDTNGESTSLYTISGALGGLIILAGMCCLGPVIASAFGSIGSRTRGVIRLTARSLARNRARTAAVVVAIASFVAIGLAASTAFISESSPIDEWNIADNIVTVWTTNCGAFIPAEGNATQMRNPAPCVLTNNDIRVQSTVDDTMKGAQRAELKWGVFEPMPYPNDANSVTPPSRLEIREPGGLLVANPLVLNSIGLADDDLSSLKDDGAIWIMDPTEFDKPGNQKMGLGSFYNETSRTIAISLMTTSGEIPLNAYVVRTRPKHASPSGNLLVTEAKARAIGLHIKTLGTIHVAKEKLRDWQRVEVQFASNLNSSTSGSVIVGFAWSWPGISSTTVETIVSMAILLVALLIVAIGLSLMAAEGKDERDVLVAIGASPRVLASIAALRAWLLTACGIALAVPIGIIPIKFVFDASARGDTGYDGIEIPWLTLALLTLVPFIAYATTRLVTIIARRARPVTMSNFAFD